MSDPYDELACNHIADAIEAISFPCGCGKSKVFLSDLDMSCAIEWLRDNIPIYHMGMLGCCEDLRCNTCEEMPSCCDCGHYVAWSEHPVDIETK